MIHATVSFQIHCLHWVTLTMTIPLSTPFFNTAINRSSSGMLPAPKVSRTNPFRFSNASIPSIISGRIPGKIRKQATWAVDRLVCTENGARVDGRLTKFQFIVVDIPTFPRELKFGDEKARKS